MQAQSLIVGNLGIKIAASQLSRDLHSSWRKRHKNSKTHSGTENDEIDARVTIIGTIRGYRSQQNILN